MERERRYRARELGIALGVFDPGPHDAITDVAGVRVGHCTLVSGEGPLVEGRGPVRTGVSAVVFDQCEGAELPNRLFGGAFVYSGAGEVAGFLQVTEWGVIETPILLTNSLSAGVVRDAAAAHLLRRYPTLGTLHDPPNPVVGECDDGYLNDMRGGHVRPEHVERALETAAGGPVAEGCVGAGTGLVTFDFKSGVGTASRRLPAELGAYTVGVLVMSNFGERRMFNVEGVPVGLHITDLLTSDQVEGSGVMVVATDAPLLPHHLRELAKRAAIGFARAGSFGSYGSGEVAVAVSTANVMSRLAAEREMTLRALPGSRSRHNPLYQAAIEATQEAVLNALCMAVTTVGRDGNVAHALPLDRLVEVLRRHGVAAALPAG